MMKELAFTQEASIDQVIVAKVENSYRKRSTLVNGTDRRKDVPGRTHSCHFHLPCLIVNYVHASGKVKKTRRCGRDTKSFGG